MKVLIVNGDDFGGSHGINRGVLEAHLRGILTSASLLVDAASSEHAVLLSRALPDLTVGLHADLDHLLRDPSTDSPDELQRELFRQLDRFRDLTGRLPTHIDSHHNAHRDPRALPHFLVLAREYHLPLREHSPVGYFSHFYGQWGGETHLEQVGVDALIGMLEKEIDDGFTELSCHPGYVDPDYTTSYSVERETELRTLCDPRIRQCLVDQAIRLVNFQGKPRLLASAPA